MSLEPTFLRPPPGDGPRISQVFVWVATNPHGVEGIIAASLPDKAGARQNLPLLSSTRALAEQMEGLAKMSADIATKAGGEPVTYQLVTYTRSDT